MRYLLIAMRPAHWVKNLFIFLPALFGGRIFDPSALLASSAAFLSFSAASSSVYLANDIIDRDKDRIHPTKRLRPIASGKLGVKNAAFASVLLGAFALLSSIPGGSLLTAIVIGYMVMNILYSRFLKDSVIIDVFCLALFFLLRIEAGSAATGVALSPWIMLMTGFLALFLGFTKRRQELRILEKRPEAHRRVLSKYNMYFIDQMVQVLTSSIVVAYMLYTLDAVTVAHVGSAHLIYTIPFVYYGIFRYLYIVHKLHKEGDPVRILLTDRKLMADVTLWAIVCVGVIYFRI